MIKKYKAKTPFFRVLIVYIGLVIFAFGLTGCDPAKVVATDYGPTEMQVLETTYWCGYQALKYPGVSGNATIPTLFKINPMKLDNIEVNTATVSEAAYIRQTYNYKCSLEGPNLLVCNSKNIWFKLQSESLETNLLTSNFHDLKLTQFIPCTQGEKLFFEEDE